MTTEVVHAEGSNAALESAVCSLWCLLHLLPAVCSAVRCFLLSLVVPAICRCFLFTVCYQMLSSVCFIPWCLLTLVTASLVLSSSVVLQSVVPVFCGVKSLVPAPCCFFFCLLPDALSCPLLSDAGNL